MAISSTSQRARRFIVMDPALGIRRRRSTAMMLDTALIAVSAVLMTRDRPSGISAITNHAGACGMMTLNSAMELSPCGASPTKARPNRPMRKMNGATSTPPSRKPLRMERASRAA
ncbi:hypothetical protein D9M69_614510 [compost metagenome]